MTTPGLTQALKSAIAARNEFRAMDRASMQVDDFEKFFALSNAYSDTKSKLAEVLDTTPADTALSGATSDARLLIFTPSTKESDSWQMTRFDRQGEPWGDTTYKTRLQGLKEFLQETELDNLATQNGPIIEPFEQKLPRLEPQERLAFTRAVNNCGKPLTLFHGTSAAFTTFAPNPRGIFFAEIRDHAESFSRIRKGVPVVMEVHLALANPWTMIRYSLDTPYSIQVDQSVEALKARGFDSIHCPDERVWIAFEPEQVIAVLQSEENEDVERDGFHGQEHCEDQNEESESFSPSCEAPHG